MAPPLKRMRRGSAMNDSRKGAAAMKDAALTRRRQENDSDGSASEADEAGIGDE